MKKRLTRNEMKMLIRKANQGTLAPDELLIALGKKHQKTVYDVYYGSIVDENSSPEFSVEVTDTDTGPVCKTIYHNKQSKNEK